MNKSKILTETQKAFLKLFSTEQTISDKFYLTGGTALAEYYIPYRLSEDLDFFSEQEIDAQEVITFIKAIKDKIKYLSLDISTSFNRNLIFLEFANNKILKTEFTYFPFPQIEKPKRTQGIKIDSIIDIAVNKLFTIYQKPRSRDFVDLYMIIKNYKLELQDIIKKARIKFDWHIDYIQLGSQFMQSTQLKDYPRLLEEVPENQWQDYFISEAKSFKNKIIS